jgi:hypothetical protein
MRQDETTRVKSCPRIAYEHTGRGAPFDVMTARAATDAASIRVAVACLTACDARRAISSECECHQGPQSRWQGGGNGCSDLPRSAHHAMQDTAV